MGIYPALIGFKGPNNDYFFGYSIFFYSFFFYSLFTLVLSAGLLNREGRDVFGTSLAGAFGCTILIPAKSEGFYSFVPWVSSGFLKGWSENKELGIELLNKL